MILVDKSPSSSGLHRYSNGNFPSSLCIEMYSPPNKRVLYRCIGVRDTDNSWLLPKRPYAAGVDIGGAEVEGVRNAVACVFGPLSRKLGTAIGEMSVVWRITIMLS